jgi:DNA-binding phage protein
MAAPPRGTTPSHAQPRRTRHATLRPQTTGKLIRHLASQIEAAETELAAALARLTDTTLGRCYRRLREAGKPAKVALTAVMSKLLIQMNHALKPA